MEIEELLQAPRESLNMELKAWINPNEPEAQAKIVKAAIAFRNINGGYLIIGFDDATCTPIIDSAPDNVTELFHQDRIQALISKHCSEMFEIQIEFGKIQDQLFPVMVVPPGVRSPVAVKARIPGNGKDLLPDNKVYVRTLVSNHTPSTAEASFKDWPTIMDVCFENREADIGRFFRRHLSGMKLDSLASIISQIDSSPMEGRLESLSFLDAGFERYQGVHNECGSDLSFKGGFEVSAVFQGSGNISDAVGESALTKLLNSNPNHTGWPFWLNSRGFQEKDFEPYFYQGGWESHICAPGGLFNPHLDFWRIELPTKLYHYRASEEDLMGLPKQQPVGQRFYFDLLPHRIAECISIAISYAHALGYDSDKTNIDMSFRWTGIKERELTTIDIGRYVRGGRISRDDVATASILIPLDTPKDALAGYVMQVANKVLILFGGMEISHAATEQIVTKTLSRRL